MPAVTTLDQTLATTDTLLGQYLEVLATPQKYDGQTSDPPPLPLLSDCARLLKAQVTKLSLLAINKPFTPSAINSVLRDTSSSCLPAMMSAVQICSSQHSIHGEFFVDEVRSRVRRVMREMLGLVREVSAVAAEAQSAKTSDQNTTGRDSLSSTGIVWSGCDDLVALTAIGVAGLAVQKAEAYRDMIKDAIAELQEWREGDDTEHEGTGDHLLDSDDEGVDGDRDSLDDIFNAANSLPADREQLRVQVEAAEGKLKKIVLLYTALIKRRLKQTPPNADEALISKLETVIRALKSISETVDELANSFYELDETNSAALLHTIIHKATICADVMRVGFRDNDDEFTAWVDKWKEVVKPDSG